MAKRIEVPHSWSVNDWPEHVYPNTAHRARYLVRAHRDELMRAGALARVGRQLVIIGAPFSRWLQRQAAAVPGYECPANRENEAA